jgi:SRSO17 transposase
MDDLQEFEQYMGHLSEGLGHADRHAGLLGYCTGLMSPLSRKSVEPMAAHVDPLKLSSRHQSLHHFVADANWSDEQMLLRVCQWVVPLMDFSDDGWWIIDDTGFPKQGRHSVGVARQYCGMLGKQDNCQVAVSVSLACEAASVPVAWQLYLPKEWADDPARRDKAGVPEALQFATKPAIALQQIEHLMDQGAPRHCVLADAGYGVDTAFRERLSELGLRYVVGVTGSVTVWPPGREPLPPAASVARGHVGTRLRLGGAALPQHHPQSIKALALGLGSKQWHTVTWREGTNAELRSRFARVRVRAAHRDNLRDEVREPEWLLIEWPKGDAEPLKYWLSTLPEDTPLQRMVFEAKMRWRIERDYQDLKQDLGLGHYEGRGWRGFHHHASLSIAAYGFLVAQRLRHPDEAGGKKNPAQRQEPALPTHYKPRGSPPGAAPRPILDHELANAYRRAPGANTPAMPVLPPAVGKAK